MVFGMGNNFQWQTDTEFDPPPDTSKLQRSWEIAGFGLTTAVIIILLAGGWFFTQRRLAQANETIRTELQTMLNLQHDAFLAGDGDLFFSTFSADPGWQAAQLLPFNQAVQGVGLHVTRVKINQDKVWANTIWKEGEETFQKLLFFEGHGSRYQQIATDSDYWGELEQHNTEWGVLYNYEVDNEWTQDITSFIQEKCPNCEFLTVMVTDHYEETAVPHTIPIPSPRIFAIDTSGQPSDAYWDMFAQRLNAHIQPTTIRIALPPQNSLNLHMFDYEMAAGQFMAKNPDIQVELVTLAQPLTDPSQLAEFDGAAFPPSAHMIASGTVYDLTPLLETDTDFDQGDFYEQLWQGTLWQERMWFMPQAATMRLLFYNKDFYQQANLAEPSLRWTWAEMGEDIKVLEDVVTAVNSTLHYIVFLDSDRDSLFAYAYNWQTDCPEAITVHCQINLTAERASAAVNWYQQLAQQADLKPIAQNNGTSRWNWQAAIRVEEPVYFEHFLQLSSMGVAPFPGSDRFDGITPLWLEGSFITQHSDQPLAVWKWLKFLSYQPPLPTHRLIPARPSVAEETNYWQRLPRPLNEAMRTAIPFGRPVTIEDQLWFDEEMITAVTNQQLTPKQIGQQVQQINWFGQK